MKNYHQKKKRATQTAAPAGLVRHNTTHRPEQPGPIQEVGLYDPSPLELVGPQHLIPLEVLGPLALPARLPPPFPPNRRLLFPSSRHSPKPSAPPSPLSRPPFSVSPLLVLLAAAASAPITASGMKNPDIAADKGTCCCGNGLLMPPRTSPPFFVSSWKVLEHSLTACWFLVFDLSLQRSPRTSCPTSLTRAASPST